MPIPLVFEHSTTVFVGKVVAVHALPRQLDTAGTNWLVDFTPLRIYKGSTAPTSIISVGYHDIDPAWKPSPDELALSSSAPDPSIGPGLFAVDDTTLAFELSSTG